MSTSRHDHPELGEPRVEEVSDGLFASGPYAELTGTPPGGPIDVVAAVTDMVTFNGGRPLTCRA